MRRLIHAALLVLMTGFAVALGPAPAWACSCAGPQSESEYVEWSDLTFTGVVVDIDEPAFAQSSGDAVSVRFSVETVAKGSSDPTVTIRTALHEASCGYGFTEGVRYRVHALNGETSLCSGNEPLGAAPEVPLESDFPYTWIAVAVGAVLVIGGIMVIRLRRRPAEPADPTAP